MKIELNNLHTIIMFCGISGSGKSTKAAQINELARNNGLKSVIVSSDDCRKELLLDNKYHHHDIEMYQISNKAFDLLMYKTEQYLKYPFNPNIVILDMMNLAMEDREKILDLANKYYYDIIAIVMDFVDVNDYFMGLDDKYDKYLIQNQLKRFRSRTLPVLGRKRYNNLIQLKSKLEPLELVCNFDIDTSTTILDDTDIKYDFIVGDIHECINTFKELLKESGFDIEMVNGIEKITRRENTRIILVGDYLDKGNKTKESIEFIYNNIDRITIVDANHENFVDRWLNNKIDTGSIDGKKMVYYTSIPSFQDEELKKKFFAIREHTIPFCISKHFIVTHAGCMTKCLGKTQKGALRAQRYYHIDRLESDNQNEWLENRRKYLGYMKEEAETCHPWHVFGHETFKNNFVYKNKVHIDTGCVYGGELTAVDISHEGRYKILHVPCKDNVYIVEKLYEFKFESPKPQLESKDYNHLKWAAQNKINFVSGTMCPANKRDNELESIDEALDYFKHKKIDKVMLQIKYMGSRCNVYLFDKVENSYAVTRNGYLLRNVDLSLIYKNLRERLDTYFKENNLELMIIDGELLPWSALGKSLIDRIFDAVDEGVSSELSLLRNNGFEEEFTRLQKEYRESTFDTDKNSMKKEEVYAKYGAQKYEAYKLLEYFNMPTISELEPLHNLYKKQLGIYAKPFDQKDLHYKPFSVLKSVKKNGDEIYYFGSDNETLFKLVNDDEYMVCDLTKEGYNKAKSFYNNITAIQNLEGVVIKPYIVDNVGCAPYLKVRSPSYLTIIYGYDYLTTTKYQQLLDQKRTYMKLKVSIEEWVLGKELLKIPYKSISSDNSIYMDLMTRMILKTNQEETIDPRL